MSGEEVATKAKARGRRARRAVIISTITAQGQPLTALSFRERRYSRVKSMLSNYRIITFSIFLKHLQTPVPNTVRASCLALFIIISLWLPSIQLLEVTSDHAETVDRVESMKTITRQKSANLEPTNSASC